MAYIVKAHAGSELSAAVEWFAKADGLSGRDYRITIGPTPTIYKLPASFKRKFYQRSSHERRWLVQPESALTPPIPENRPQSGNPRGCELIMPQPQPTYSALICAVQDTDLHDSAVQGSELPSPYMEGHGAFAVASIVLSGMHVTCQTSRVNQTDRALLFRVTNVLHLQCNELRLVTSKSCS